MRQYNRNTSERELNLKDIIIKKKKKDWLFILMINVQVYSKVYNFIHTILE